MAKRGRKSWEEIIKSEEAYDCNYGTINGKYSKYKKGDPIPDITTLLEQNVVIWGETTKNIESLKNLPLRIILMSLVDKYFYYAIPKEKRGKK